MITNHLWQSTWFAIATGLLTVAFRSNRAHVRYWLWLSASLKFLVPFALLVSLGSHLRWAPAAGKIVSPGVSFAVHQITEPFPETLRPAPFISGIRDGVPIVIPLILIAVWGCGFSGVALMRLRAWLRIRAAIRCSTPIDIPATVEVRSSPGLMEPGVAGLLRPILLLPEGIVELLTPSQLEAVLAHELCHVRRRDNLFASIHMVVEAMFWFHPLVWWIGARLVEERERACDEEVLSLGGEPHTYAEAILNVCKFYVESPVACVSGVTGSDIKQRIEAIMANRIVPRLNLPRKAALIATGIAALAGPVLVGVVNAPFIRAQSAAVAVPKFETASIKPCSAQPGLRSGAGYTLSPGSMNTGCVPLADVDNTGLIQRAYVRFANGHFQSLGIVPIQGGPAWIHSEIYDIHARAEGNPSPEMMQGPMLQALLEDRFKLKIHRETREVPVYALVVAQGSSKLKPFNEGSCTPMPLTVPPPAGQQYCKVRVSVKRPVVDAEGETLDGFSKLLDLVLDRPVIDNTGLSGRFDIHLEFAIDAATPRFLPGGDWARFADAGSDTGVPSIFTAIQQQLGLKLEPANGSREFLVIDQVEKPSEE